MARRPPLGFILLTAILLLVGFVLYFPHPTSQQMNKYITGSKASVPTSAGDEAQVDHETLKGEVVMGKLGNETAKAELGRAAWKLFHTTMAGFPEHPTEDESGALKSYIWLFARLYPCGECASHFQQILKKYPPQTSSRNTAAGWACFVHNEVNKSKGKPMFDCNNIGDFYDCGCAKDDEETMAPSDKSKSGDKRETVEISREGPTRGG